MRTPPARHASGFTLIEVLTVCAVAGVLAGVALPSYQGQLQRSRRADAVAALTRLQWAQERAHAATGMYSDDLRALHSAATSSEGLYSLAVELTGADGWRATATAVAGGAQAGDGACARLSVEVVQGFTRFGPSPDCWNR